MTKEGKDKELTDEVTETRNLRAQPTITSIEDERSQTEFWFLTDHQPQRSQRHCPEDPQN